MSNEERKKQFVIPPIEPDVEESQGSRSFSPSRMGQLIRRFSPVLVPLPFAILIFLFTLPFALRGQAFLPLLPLGVLLFALVVMQGTLLYYAGSNDTYWTLFVIIGYVLFLVVGTLAIFGLGASLLLLFLFLIVGTFLARRSIRQVPEGSVDIVLLYGKYARTLYPGPNLKMPWEKVSSRVTTKELSWTCPEQVVKISRDQDVKLVATISYQLLPEDAHIAALNVDNWEASLQKQFVATMQSVINELTSADFVNWSQGPYARTSLDINSMDAATITRWDRINNTLASRVQDKVAIWGVQINYVRIQDISLIPHSTYAAVEISDATIIRTAISNTSYNDYQQISKAIIRHMGAFDETPITTSLFESYTVWDISLPSIGLRLDTGRAIFFLRTAEKKHIYYDRLIEIKIAKGADFLIVVDFLNIGKLPSPIDSSLVWLKPENLEEMVNTPKNEVVAWLGRLVASQVKNFEDLIRYQTEGSADLDIFFGRDYELQRLSIGNVRGGIIIGAHQSGKTSLLARLSERLANQHYVVGPPYTIHSANFRTFFGQTLNRLNISIPTTLSLESWSSILRDHSKKGKRLALLLDEADTLIEQDANTGYILGREIRALQNDGYCKFYLAGHNKLREAIELESGPFRNFAEEITLRGLDQSAAIRLIREPIRAIGFNVSEEQAQRIYEGTAGVAVLIQGFCKRLLLKIHRSRDSHVKEAAIKTIEEDPEYLNRVFQYYDYAQTPDSMAVMLIIADLKEVTRQDIIQKFTEYGIELTWDRLEDALKFLVKFGVLKEFEAGRYQLLSKYLSKAIESRTRTDAFLVSELEKGKRER